MPLEASSFSDKKIYKSVFYYVIYTQKNSKVKKKMSENKLKVIEKEFEWFVDSISRESRTDVFNAIENFCEENNLNSAAAEFLQSNWSQERYYNH